MSISVPSIGFVPLENLPAILLLHHSLRIEDKTPDHSLFASLSARNGHVTQLQAIRCMGKSSGENSLSSKKNHTQSLGTLLFFSPPPPFMPASVGSGRRE